MSRPSATVWSSRPTPCRCRASSPARAPSRTLSSPRCATTLEALAQDLRDDGWIVARHYCFLAPGDPDVGQRIAVEVMTANLTAELLDDDRLEDISAGLGGDVAALELVLDRADRALANPLD